MQSRILQKYLFRELIHYFLIFLGIFITVLMIQEIYDSRSDLTQNDPQIGIIARFLIYSIPHQLSQVLPIIGLMTTMFAYGLLAKNREILAMICSGLSFRQLAWPAVVFGIILSITMFIFDEKVVPSAQAKANYIEQVKLKGRDPDKISRRKDVFVRGSQQRIYFMQSYNYETKRMLCPSVFELSEDGNMIVRRIDAIEAHLLEDPNHSDASRIWVFDQAEEWRFSEKKNLQSYIRHSRPLTLRLEPHLDVLLSKTKSSEEMNFEELSSYLAALKGFSSSENMGRQHVELYLKLVFPLSCFLISLLGYLAVIDVHARKFTKGIILGIASSVGFYILVAFMKTLGSTGIIMPLFAAWMPLCIFCLFIFILASRLRTIRS